MNLEESACVYWDFKADNFKGAWSTEGCSVNSIVNQTIICHCNHLTNFAAMMVNISFVYNMYLFSIPKLKRK